MRRVRFEQVEAVIDADVLCPQCCSETVKITQALTRRGELESMNTLRVCIDTELCGWNDAPS